MKEYSGDRRDYSMLMKYLESEFTHVKDKIDVIQEEQKLTRKELKSLQEEVRAHYDEEYPHKICRTNSERIKNIEKQIVEYLRKEEQTKAHNSGVKKGVYLSAKVIKYIIIGAGALLFYVLDLWTKIKGFMI